METIENPIRISSPSFEQNIKVEESSNYQQHTKGKYKYLALVIVVILAVVLPIVFIVLIGQKSSEDTSKSTLSPAEWLFENAVHIKSNSIYESSVADLEPLKSILSNISVVFLTENMHGVGISSTSRGRFSSFFTQS